MIKFYFFSIALKNIKYLQSFNMKLFFYHVNSYNTIMYQCIIIIRL